MQYTYMLNGGCPVIKRYKTAASHLAGIILLTPAGNATGVSVSTTTDWDNSVGLALDRSLSAAAPIAYSTTQGDPEPTQSVLISPSAVLRALLVGSATNAALEQRVVGTASSDGLTAVGTAGETDPNSPNMDEGTVWYNSGSNGGASRKITSTANPLTVTVIVPFAANRVGDRFMTIDYSQGQVTGVTMSTNLLNVRGEMAATGSTNGATVDFELNGTTDSYLHLVQLNHAFASS
jgi:hypothetical protein